MRNDPLQRLTTGAATAFCAAALSVYPLYIDRFSNLGVTKFTGVFTLFLLWGFAIGACVLIGARTVPGRFAAARRDVSLWSLAAFAIARACGRPLLEAMFPPRLMEKYDHFMGSGNRFTRYSYMEGETLGPAMTPAEQRQYDRRHRNMQ